MEFFQMKGTQTQRRIESSTTNTPWEIKQNTQHCPNTQ